MEDTKIILITYYDEDRCLRVSHGIGNVTLKTYPLPDDKLSSFPATFDESISEWYISA